MRILFNDTATTEIYTLSLHDALPICDSLVQVLGPALNSPDSAERLNVPYSVSRHRCPGALTLIERALEDRKSTRLNSSHANISYAVFCLKTTTPPPPFTSRSTLSRSR